MASRVPERAEMGLAHINGEEDPAPDRLDCHHTSRSRQAYVVHREHRALGRQAQVFVGQPHEPTMIDRPPVCECGWHQPCLILLGCQAANMLCRALAPAEREERGPAQAVTAALADGPHQMMTIKVMLHSSVPGRRMTDVTVVKPSDRQELFRRTSSSNTTWSRHIASKLSPTAFLSEPYPLSKAPTFAARSQTLLSNSTQRLARR